MQQTWRWFGPHDRVSVDDMLQAGVQGVDTALHDIPPGEIWSPDAIATRQAQLAVMRDGSPSGLGSAVVESLPVSEAIKTQSGDWRAHVAHWITSMRNLRKAGLRVICYNFMPILDWTRTDLAWRRPSGARCMRFDLVDFAAFDIHILRRPGAAESFPEGIREAADRRFADMDPTRRAELARNIVQGLPGAVVNFSLDDVRDLLASYADIGTDRLRANFHAFLEQVAPVAQDILDDIGRGGAPGYPAIGRLKGLAELRGVGAALAHGRPR